MSDWRLARALHPKWSMIDRFGDGARFRRTNGLTLIVCSDVYDDGKRWVHLSVAHRHRMPKWRELVEVRDWILGPQAKAIQVLAPASQHVNINQYCLHLFCCVDGDPLPDFTMGTGSL